MKLTDASFDSRGVALRDRLAAEQRPLAAVGLSLLLVGGLAATLMVLMACGTARTVASAQAAAEALAPGDLTCTVQAHARDETGHMAHTLGAAMGQLAGLVREIKATGESVGTASAQIAAGNNDLSARTEQTSANLQNAA